MRFIATLACCTDVLKIPVQPSNASNPKRVIHYLKWMLFLNIYFKYCSKNFLISDQIIFKTAAVESMCKIRLILIGYYMFNR